MTDIRDKSAALLSSTLEGLAPSNAQANERAVALEAAVFDKHAGQTGNEYRNEVRQLSLDMGKNNTEMGQRVAEGSLAPQSLVQMSGDVSRRGCRASLTLLICAFPACPAIEVGRKSSSRHGDERAR